MTSSVALRQTRETAQTRFCDDEKAGPRHSTISGTPGRTGPAAGKPSRPTVTPITPLRQGGRKDRRGTGLSLRAPVTPRRCCLTSKVSGGEGLIIAGGLRHRAYELHRSLQLASLGPRRQGDTGQPRSLHRY